MNTKKQTATEEKKKESKPSESSKSQEDNVLSTFEFDAMKVFTIANTEENGWVVALGQDIAIKRNTKEECMKAIEEKDWELIFNTSVIVSMNTYEMQKSKETL